MTSLLSLVVVILTRVDVGGGVLGIGGGVGFVGGMGLLRIGGRGRHFLRRGFPQRTTS